MALAPPVEAMAGEGGKRQASKLQKWRKDLCACATAWVEEDLEIGGNPGRSGSAWLGLEETEEDLRTPSSAALQC